ncbi:DUF975 family protein [Levilactobacillus suantsaiihabitans]|uniref:DUF975 family protein n=1 Tax=Levilactobacillus suantsaiihabitans TaxID=2487722 RepID=A0A4Z0J8I9_9LACO|nr:DUF975 family protein [Levilactobacillus suantsaiihabitans]TGD17748.1 DUF975 family protein [Levilactobacillus suantsaiihabitans]
MDKQDRVNFKLGAKQQVSNNFKFYLLLSILWMAMQWIGGSMYARDLNWAERVLSDGSATVGWNGFFSFAGLFFLVASMLRMGVRLTMIDLDRGKIEADNPIQRSFALFDKGQYFLGWIFISILTGIFVALWSLLFVFPGIIKAYAYSQAFYIYRDAVDRGEKMTALEAITASRKLMDGNKAFLFIMDLSFILWFMVEAITFNIAGLFVNPYYDLTRAKFYNQLVVREQDVPGGTQFTAPGHESEN